MAQVSNKKTGLTQKSQSSVQRKKPQVAITKKSETAVVAKKGIKPMKLANTQSTSAAGSSFQKLTVYEQQKRKKNAKKKFFTISLFIFIVLFFTFGLVARPIFGADAEITKIAEDNILAVINIVRLMEDYLGVIIKSLSMLFLGFIIIIILLFITKLIGNGSSRRKTVASLLSSFIKYIGAIVTFMFVLSSFGVNTATLLASVGILGIIVGLGAQSLISDILAGLFIVFENSFQVGDIITFDNFRGEVVSIGLRTTRFKDIGDDVKIVNNSELRIFVNMAQHSSFAVCDITIDYSEKIEKVEKILEAEFPKIAETLKAITEGPMYRKVIEFSERGVVLRIVARCDEADRIQLVRDLHREVKVILDKNKIKLAVPQVQIRK